MLAINRHHRIKRIIAAISAAALIILSVPALLYLRFPQKVEAGWFDDSWNYRKQITFGNSGSADSNKKVLFQLDTATLITAGKMQSSCQDVRFTDANGLLLRYYINVGGGAGVGCNDASSDFYVLMPTISTGDNLLYFYHGNPGAPAGTESANFSEATFTPTSGPTTGSEEKGPSPSAYWKFDEGVDRAANDSSTNQNTLRMNPLTGVEQQINILDQEFISSSTSYTPTDNSLGLVRWDGSKYSGETVYFEAVIQGTGGGSPTFFAALFENGGTQVTGSEVSTGTADVWTRLRSSAITLTDGTDYTVRIKRGNGVDTYIKAARLIVVQSASSGISNTQTQIEAGNVERQSSTTATQLTDKKIYQYDSSKFSPAPTAYFEATLRSVNATIEQQVNIIDQQFTTTSTTYAPTDNSLGLVRWDGSKYSGETVYFEVVLRGDGAGSPTFFAALFDSSGTQVTGSEVSFASTDVWQRLRSSAITLSDGTDYTVRIHRNNGANTYIRAARLIVVQTGDSSITDTETQVEVGNNQTTTATTDTQLTDKKIYRFTSAEFSPAPTVYFEATLSNDTAGQTAYASLYTDGASCSSQVTSSEVSVTGTSWSRVRSVSITLTTGTDYMVCIKASANNARIANAKIILDQTAGGGITDVELIHQEINTLRTDADSGYTEQDFDNRLSPDIGITGGNLAGGTFTYFYEASLKTSAGTGRAELWNDTNNATITSSEVSTISTSYIRARSGDISANVPTSEGNDNFKDLDTRIRNDASNTTSAASTWLIIQVSSLATSDVNAYADLYNLTDATSISGSEVSTTSTSWTRVRSSSVTLTTAKDYVVRIRSGVANAAIHLGNAKLVLDQQAGSVTALEVVQEHINTLKTDADTTYTEQDFDNQFGPTNFSGGTFTYYFEATLKTSNAANSARAELWNDTDNLTITSSEVTTTSTSYARVRSGDITANMPGSAKTMDTRLRNSSTDTTSASTSWIVIQGTAVTAGGGVAVWQNEEYCVFGKCLFYDGVDDVTIAGNTDSIDLDRHIAGALTFQGWVKVNSDGEGNVGEIFDKGSPTYLRITNEGADGFADLEASLDLGTTDATVAVTNGITLNKWHHVVLVYTDDGDDEITIYIDANNRGSSTLGDGAPAADANNLLVGGSSTANFHGFIDEFKIYKSERTAAEIKTDFVKGSSSLHGVQAAFGIRDYSFLSDGLVGYWKMDENTGTTTSDSSGNGNTSSTLTGNVAWIGGKFYSGLDFDGTGDVVEVPESASIDFGASDSYTVSAWIYKDNDADSGEFIAKRLAGTGFPIRFIVDSDETITWTYRGSDIGTSAVGTTAISLNAWHHVVGVRNVETNTAYLYVDGILDATGNDTTTGTLGNNNPISFGDCAVGCSTNAVDIRLDDVRIYKRAFTPREVQQLYNWAPGPVGYWKLDENTGTTAVDSSGNGYTSSAFTGNTTWTSGRYGSGLSFDGTDDVVRIVEATSTDIGATTDSYTAEAWINTTANYSSNASAFAKNDATGAYPFDLYLNSSEFACFQISDGTLSPSTCGSIALNNGNWHHLVGKRDVGTDTIYIFVDGVQINSTADTTTATAANNDDLSIGNAGASYIGADFNGSIDNVQLYNYARTAAQIIEDMNAGHPAPGSPVGSPVIYWKYDEQQGTVANDTIGNENGTVDSAAAWNLENSTSGGCKLNGCLEFDAAAEEVLITDANDADINFNGTETFSGSAWVRIATMPGSGEADAIIAKWDGTTTARAYRLYVENDDADTTGNFEVQIMDQSASQSITATQANDSVSTNTWYHVSFTFNGGTAGAAGDLKLYVDGRFTAQNSANASFLGLEDVAADFTVAEYDATDVVATNTALTGRVDEVKVYSAELTADQVKVDATAGSSSAFGGVLGTHDNEGFGGNPPVGWWMFNENTGTTANDTSGNGNNGTLSSTIVWDIGKFGSGLSTNIATNLQNVTVSDPASGILDFSDTQDYTIEMWYKATANEANTHFPFWKGGITASEIGYQFRVLSTGLVQCIYTDGDGTGSDSSGSSVSNVEDGNWHHISCVMDRNGSEVGTTGLHLFIDGVLEASDTSLTEGSAASNTNNLVLGEDNPAREFTGGIDEARIYNYARSRAQIVYDFNRGQALGYWKLDECSGATANDSGFGANNGTITIGASGTNTSNGTCGGAAGQGWFDGVTGKRNASLEFDGNDDRVDMSNPTDLQLERTSPMTLEAWFKTTTDGGMTIFSKQESTAPFRGYNLQTGSGGFIFFQLVNTYCTNCIEARNTTAVTYNDGNWHHVAATYDGSSSAAGVNLYFDGTLRPKTSSDSLSATILNSVNFYIGSRNNAQQFFNGQIDEVKIFNYALTADQVKKDFLGSAQRFGPSEGSP